MGTLLLLWMLSHTTPTSAQIVATPWPCTIAVGKNGPSLLPTAWELSPTLQHQCRRLAAAKVVVVVRWADDLTPLQHAETRIMMNEGRVFRAVVRLRASDEPAVHLVHELEHVMEALDGIDQRSTTLAWQTRADAYETARARRIETWARRELAPMMGSAR